jgi:NAD(P)-dependent dehydrogenase (short-subunit alcohol dehydrogenase family)
MGSSSESTKKSAVVLGARNLGGAIVERLLGHGWRVAGVARSEDTLERLQAAGALALEGDASDPEELGRVLDQAAAAHGGLDLVVNAVSASRPVRPGPFGGGPLADAQLEDFQGWTGAVAEQGFVFLSEGTRALKAAGGGGALVQITGGSARRAIPGKGLWAAGAFALRALTQAAALELRDEQIHVALLIVDATIDSPGTADYTDGRAPQSLAKMDEIAAAVEYLAAQGPRGYSHELILTPAGENWTP